MEYWLPVWEAKPACWWYWRIRSCSSSTVTGVPRATITTGTATPPAESSSAPGAPASKTAFTSTVSPRLRCGISSRREPR